MNLARTAPRLAAGVAMMCLAWAGVATASADADPSPQCRDRPGRTLTERGAERVLLRRHEVRACVPGVVRPGFIGDQWRPAVSSSGGGGVLRVAVDGAFVASSAANFSDAYDDVGFSVRDVRRRQTVFGRYYASQPVAGDDRQAEAADLLLCRGGQVVFIVGFRSGRAAPIESYDVQISDGRSTVLLARGSDIEPGSLRATPGLIAWRASGVRATAAVPCAAPSRSVPVPQLDVDDDRRTRRRLRRARHATGDRGVLATRTQGNPAAMSLRTASVRATVAVSDIARARAFYEQQLGLVPDAPDGPIAMYPCGGGHLQVYESPDHAGKATATVASWSVDDYDAVIDELRGRGVGFVRQDGLDADPRGVHAFGDHRVAWCADPDGNVLAIDNGQTGGM